MHKFAIFILLCAFVCQVLGSLRVSERGANNIKARDDAVDGDRYHLFNEIVTMNETFTFNETFTAEVLRLPAGFNFDNSSLDLTRQDFGGGMVSFSDWELDKIDGHDVTVQTILTYLKCETSDASPLAEHVQQVMEKINALGDTWCCQKQLDLCTRMWSVGEAASDICGTKFSPYPSQQDCIRCKEAAQYIGAIIWWCTDKWNTKKTGGWVRYVFSFPFMSDANRVIQS
jgi:hypothetical protein